MRIKLVKAEKTKDSRKENTISVFVKTEKGLFSCSSPNGKSIGKFEAKPYIENVDKDIALVNLASKKIEKIRLNDFNDLEEVEAVVKLGANSLFALEAALLKALAAEEDMVLWQLLDDKAKRFPVPIGNCIGGGLHTKKTRGKKPDFQEFLFLPRGKNFTDRVFLLKKAWEICGERLKLRKAVGKLNDEGAWSTSLNNEECLEVLQETKEELGLQIDNKIGIGIDVAASSFYTGFLYNYQNPKKRLNNIRQIGHIEELINNFLLEYVEDPLEETKFNDFKLLRESVIRTRPVFIAGDDLTTTNLDRFKLALKQGSINSLIIKPNQIGSLIATRKIIELAKEKNIVTIMSHRSGETLDYTIADLAFGWQCEFIKTGVHGKEREVKLNRLINIEKGLS